MTKVEITIDELRENSLFLGVPMYGGNCTGSFCKSTNELSALFAKYNIQLTFFYLFNESLVQRARNYIVDEFLRSNSTHLMFIDADIAFDANDVLTLFAMQIKHPDLYDILTAVYPKKTIAWEKVEKAALAGRGKENPFDLKYYSADFVFNPLENTKSFKITDVVPISEAGTGFMLIPRTVFKTYDKHYPEYLFRPDHTRSESFDGSREIMAYFDCKIDPVTKRYLSEDFFFCQNCINIGIRLHMCPWMKLKHVGTYVYEGSMAHLAVINASPTADKTSNPKSYNKQK